MVDFTRKPLDLKTDCLRLGGIPLGPPLAPVFQQKLQGCPLQQWEAPKKSATKQMMFVEVESHVLKTKKGTSLFYILILNKKYVNKKATTFIQLLLIIAYTFEPHMVLPAAKQLLLPLLYGSPSPSLPSRKLLLKPPEPLR